MAAGDARCVHHLVQAQVARTPDAVAVTDGDRALDYAQLDLLATVRALHLRARGVGPEQLVGLFAVRSVDAMISLLAILKAGAAYVALDPAQPQARLERVIADASLTTVLVDAALRERVPATVRHTLVHDRAATWQCEPPNGRSVGAYGLVRPANLAYQIYTSGTTGAPKAVAVSHRSVVNHCTNAVERLALTSTDRVLQFSSLSFDAAIGEIYPTWAAGATLVLAPPSVMSSADFCEFLSQHDISVVSLPSSYWHHWVDDMERSSPAVPRSVRLVYVGGEKVSPQRLRVWKSMQCTAGVQWLSDYGPSETTLVCAAFRPEPNRNYGDIPLGRAIANAVLYVLDDDQRPVAPGAVGEIYIAGAGLARGYARQPALTAERFVPDPHGPAGARMYRSGDRGRMSATGELEFLGRTDDQIKILGQRVEPREVEDALRGCDGVRDAVVITPLDADGVPRLVAYAVAAQLDEAAVRKQLATVLPTVMIPTVIVGIDQLPLSPVTGKVDRAQLPAIAGQRDASSLDGASRLELAVARVWADVIGHTPRTVDDDFFACGGDSLRALRLLNRMTELTGFELSIAALFRARTVRALARALVAELTQREQRA